MKKLNLHTVIISFFLLVGMSLSTSCSKSNNDLANEKVGGDFELTLDGKKYTGTEVERLEDNVVTMMIIYKVEISNNIKLTIMIPTSEYSSGSSEIGSMDLLIIDKIPYMAVGDGAGGYDAGKIIVKGTKKIEIKDGRFSSMRTTGKTVEISGTISVN